MPRYHDGQETFDCLLCRDTGSVIVVHPKSVARIKAGGGQAMVDEPAKHPLYTGVVRCYCKHAVGMDWIKSIYEEYRFCDTGDDWGVITTAEQVARVEDWLGTRRAPNHAEEFDVFAE